MLTMPLTLQLLCLSLLLCSCQSWSQRSVGSKRTSALASHSDDAGSSHACSRRDYLGKAIAVGSSCMATSLFYPGLASALPSAEDVAGKVTDKVFVEVKGLPTADGAQPATQRIVIGLFGNDAPQSVEKLKMLMGPGLPSVCKPKEERVLQREQLEANKVYNSCIESEKGGVNYDYAQLWRIVKDERIDFGSVAGRFISREYPSWEESQPSGLSHDRPGLVSVRKGSNSGFGFTIFPGGSGATEDLNENHIVVGQVIEGLDVIELINTLPVVASAKLNYKGIAGGTSFQEGPSRACRYGGKQLYCNEFKPLQKLTMYQTGIL